MSLPVRGLAPLFFLLTACGRVIPASAPAPAAPEAAPEPVLQGSAPGTPGLLPGSDAPTVSAADVDRSASGLFGESRAEPLIQPADDSADVGGGDSEPTWDIDVRSFETFDRVRHYVAQFTGPARDRISDRLSEGTRYEAMIRERLRAGGLPEDMYYLALVESGFNPHAYSRAAAVGMWQFMTTTARGMGLRVDWWIDERRDPIRSTEAAVRFLRGLNEQFGSMYLAAAAYNGGPGRVARGLNRHAGDLEGTSADEMFFALAERKVLRSETSNYVPQLIAVALVAKEAARHGLVIEQREPFIYDSAWVRGRTPLAVLARATDTTVATIQELNPHVLRGMTPPLAATDSIKVRIPVGTRARFDSMMASLPDSVLTGARTIKAPPGATWASIARAHSIPARALPLYNPKVKPAPKTGRITAGTPVLVPSRAVVAAALTVPDPAVERYGTGTTTHVVRAGENLSVIAKRYRTTPAAIMRQNRLKKAVIFPGQELLVSRGTR